MNHRITSLFAAAGGAFVIASLAAGCQHNHADSGLVPVAHADGNGSAVAAPFASPPLLQGTPDVAALAARVKPVVVNITTTHNVRSHRVELPFDFGPFGRGGDDGDVVRKQTALGSGVIIDAAGHVVTNAHVVDDADTVKVRLADDREFSAKVKGRDPRTDIAVLAIEGAKDLPFASLGSSEQLQVGQYVVAVGNPFGLGHTVTMGIVSAKGRAIGAGPYDDFIQTDASINPGNSGGPLFDLRGQVVGINTAINPQGRGIGFAIPVDEVKDVVPQLLATGHVARGRIGVAIQPVDAAMARALGLDRPKGALVGEVEPGSPAERAGLKSGDVITAVDGAEIQRSEELPRTVARHAPGTTVKLTVLRDKAAKQFDVALAPLKERPEKQASLDGDDANEASPAAAPGALGVRIADIAGQGVIIRSVVPGSSADGSLRPGDRILEVNRHPVSTSTEVQSRLKETPAGQPYLLKVKRDDVTRFVAIDRES